MMGDEEELAGQPETHPLLEHSSVIMLRLLQPFQSSRGSFVRRSARRSNLKCSSPGKGNTLLRAQRAASVPPFDLIRTHYSTSTTGKLRAYTTSSPNNVLLSTILPTGPYFVMDPERYFLNIISMLETDTMSRS